MTNAADRMKNKRKEHFINDKRRRSYLASVYTRMYRGKSALIEGAYGAGKTRFLQLNPLFTIDPAEKIKTGLARITG
jgi:ABC-type lipoprotein export system ATPase subunit